MQKDCILQEECYQSLGFSSKQVTIGMCYTSLWAKWVWGKAIMTYCIYIA